MQFDPENQNTDPELNVGRWRQFQLRARAFFSKRRNVWLLVVSIIVVSAVSFGLFIRKAYQEVPEIASVQDYRPLGVTQILSVDNGKSEVIAEFYKERRYLANVDQIPRKIIEAFVSAEDSAFFEHSGINYFAILRAAIANFKAGHVVQGGSTITQQIAKSLYLSPERNLARKAREFFLAYELEKNLTKDEILYLYLNQIYLGSGAYGVKAAAETYFRKDLKDLTLAEMALIAGLPTAPGKYSPRENPERAKERQLYVLKRMNENGYISGEERQIAANEVLRIFVRSETDDVVAPDLVEHIRRYLAQNYGEKALYEEGLTVVLPAAKRFYKHATESLQLGLEEYDQRKGYRGPIEKVPADQWATRTEELRKDFVREHIPYRILKPDGSLDANGAIQEFDPRFHKTLIGKVVPGLVTEIAADGNSAKVDLGVVQVQLNAGDLRWAYDAKKPPYEVKSVREVLQVGDLIRVRVFGLAGNQNFVARLTQVPEVQGALYSVDVQTGQILAMVGSYDFKLSEFNRAIQAKRQMGSTFKPFIYAAAVERGYTPASIIVDAPIVFNDEETGTWKPENYEEKFYGDTIFRSALINSRNIPTIKIVQDLKIRNVIRFAKRLGLPGPFNEDLSISLGSGTATLQDLVHAFTAFPMYGKKFNEVLFQKITNRDGKVLETFGSPKGGNAAAAALNAGSETNPTPAQPAGADSTAGNSSEMDRFPYAPTDESLRLDPRVAYVMTHLMKEVVEFGTARRATSLGRSLAGKTGTTQDHHDTWFVGFSPRIVTGVWVGFDDSRSLGRGETGGNTALPIWINFMKNVLSETSAEDFAVPEGIVFSTIHPRTGRASKAANAITEAFIAGTEPGSRLGRRAIVEGEGNENENTLNPPSAEDEDEFLKED